MNRTPLIFGLLAAMFAGAVVVTWSAFTGRERVGEEQPRELPSGPEDPPSDYQRDPDKEIRSGVAVRPAVPENPVLIPSMARLAESLNDPEASAEDDLGVVEELIRNYQQRLSRVPTGGLNEEIVGSLRGRNPWKLVYIGEKNAKLNEKGELLDRFGTPYFFHPISETRIDVRSAGPDRKLWTEDDVWLGE
ncbi:MAG: hypothetical protein ACKJSK_06750 [Roseibacillus sp.]|jgi:hypothetical protein